MKIEHVAFVMQDPAAAAKWYAENMGFTIKRAMNESPFTHFLADDSGKVMIEIYNPPHLRVPDYRDTDPMMLHLALVSADVEADRKRWMAAGATPLGEATPLDNGDVLAMLRDPWGFAIQLVQRGEPMV
jgi:predicted enzyme related to lactoylglutathione lyase